MRVLLTNNHSSYLQTVHVSPTGGPRTAGKVLGNGEVFYPSTGNEHTILLCENQYSLTLTHFEVDPGV